MYSTIPEAVKEWNDAHAVAGDRLVFLRKRVKMSRAKLSRAANIPYSTLERIENNVKRVTVCNALRLSVHLNCTPAYIIFGL